MSTITATPITNGATRAGEAFAHWTALSVGGDHLGAVAHRLALQVFAQSHAALAHAHPAGLGLPDVVVAVDRAVHRAVCSQAPRVDCRRGREVSTALIRHFVL